MKYNRISADCHLDMPWMPPTLFTEECSREFKDRMPYVTDGPDGPTWVTKKGANFGLKNGVGPSGAKLVPGQNRRVDIMADTGLFADGKKDIRRVSDPHLRAKDMDRDGVDAEVIFGVLGTASKMDDLPAANEVLRIYNDWLVDFCSHYPDRHIGPVSYTHLDVYKRQLQAHFRAPAHFGDCGVDVAVRDAAKPNMPVRIMAAEIHQPVIVNSENFIRRRQIVHLRGSAKHAEDDLGIDAVAVHVLGAQMRVADAADVFLAVKMCIRDRTTTPLPMMQSLPRTRPEGSSASL